MLYAIAIVAPALVITLAGVPEPYSFIMAGMCTACIIVMGEK